MGQCIHRKQNDTGVRHAAGKHEMPGIHGFLPLPTALNSVYWEIVCSTDYSLPVGQNTSSALHRTMDTGAL